MYGTESGEWRIEFNFNDKVSSVQEALKWIQFLFVSSEEKTFELERVRISTQDRLDDLLYELSKIKTYFEVLSELEQEYDIDFECIDNYNEQNLTNALIVLSYYSKSSIRHTIDEDGHFVFHVDETKLNGSIPILKNANLMMTCTHKLGKVVLCGKEFTFNYLITIYNDITLTKCEQVVENEHLYLTDFSATTDTEDILVVDNLPDFYRGDIGNREEEGLALYYKPGEREKYGVLESVMMEPFPSVSETEESNNEPIEL